MEAETSEVVDEISGDEIDTTRPGNTTLIRSKSEEDAELVPELRLVKRDDPEAYSFNTPQFSAHKLPKDVVDASGNGEAALREFICQWRDILNRQ